MGLRGEQKVDSGLAAKPTEKKTENRGREREREREVDKLRVTESKRSRERGIKGELQGVK